MDGVSTVIHPMVAYDLKSNLTNTFANANGNDVSNEALRSWFVGRLGGVKSLKQLTSITQVQVETTNKVYSTETH